VNLCQKFQSRHKQIYTLLVSDVASPEIWGKAKIVGGTKYLILGV